VDNFIYLATLLYDSRFDKEDYFKGDSLRGCGELWGSSISCCCCYGKTSRYGNAKRWVIMDFL